MPDVTETHRADSVPNWRIGNAPRAAWSYPEGVTISFSIIFMMDEDFTNFDVSLTYINTYSLIITHEVYEFGFEDRKLRVLWDESGVDCKFELSAWYATVSSCTGRCHSHEQHFAKRLFVLISSSSILPLQLLFYSYARSRREHQLMLLDSNMFLSTTRFSGVRSQLKLYGA